MPVEIIAVTPALLKPHTGTIFSGRENCRFMAHNDGDNEEKHVFFVGHINEPITDKLIRYFV